MGTYSYLEEKPSREYKLNRSFKIKKKKKKKLNKCVYNNKHSMYRQGLCDSKVQPFQS